jgi:hypothetical protein
VGARVDYSGAKTARIAEREEQQRLRTEAIHELASHAGCIGEVRLSDGARAAFLELHAQALGRQSRPLKAGDVTWAEARLDGSTLRLEVRASPGAMVSIRSASGSMVIHNLAVELRVSHAEQQRIFKVQKRAGA